MVLHHIEDIAFMAIAMIIWLLMVLLIHHSIQHRVAEFAKVSANSQSNLRIYGFLVDKLF